MNWTYRQPVAIRFGNGALTSLYDEITALGGRRGLLVTSPSFVKRGLAERVRDMSHGLIGHVYGAVSPNPDVTECDECTEMLRRHGCDFVVAMGGGSVMDCAKAAAAFCTADAPAAAYLGDGKPMPDAHLPLIAIPTTAGTGSEITSVAVLSDHARGIKAPLSADSMYPAVAIVDPELTYTVPPYVTACTGFDVLCHAIEAYWSRRHQPVCDALAVQAAGLVFEYLAAACENPSDHTAREKMAEASVTAGLAFAQPKTTSAHACSYPLTNMLGIPHGEACALTIDRLVRLNSSRGDIRTARLAGRLGFTDAGALADAIADLRERVGLRSDLRDLAITDTQFEALVEGSKHPNLLNNPVEVTDDDLRMMYAAMR